MVSLYSTGLELGNLLLGSDLLDHSWDAISKLQKETFLEDPSLPFSVKYQVYEYPTKFSIIAFVCSPNYAVNHLQEEFKELVSLDEITSFDFLCTKSSSSISLHKAAFTLFASLENDLPLLKQQFTSSQPLIVTGHSLGGSVASLFTLWLLNSLPRYGVQRLLCITFGSPLLGNNGFQKAISESQTWSSCFLHVVSNTDPIPGFLISDLNANLTNPSCYMPFGTYLFCSGSGFSCFEEPQSILELLMIMSSTCAESENLNNCSQVIDYGHSLEQLKSKAVCRGISELPDSISNPLQAGTYLLLEATRFGKLQENVNLSDLAMNIAIRAKIQAKHKQKVFDPVKRLSITKTSMSYLEWYMKNSLEEAGYYDKYKTRRSRSRDEIESTESLIKHHRTLKLFWKRIVTEVENLPWKEGRKLRMRYLYAATSYRRMVEPLDIAEYYGRGKKDYVSHGRSEHYKLLEKWSTDEDIHTYQRSQASSLTVDSCFWAYVEEALISCEVLKDGKSSLEDQESARGNLIKFEDYVMDMINNFLVSPEIFLPQSSFMLWWKEYCIVVGNSSASPLSNFMKDEFHRYV
ncbi:senescence-associated carboxylesterase 101-like [Lycium barbarum]|uniref:senescence-associated carboxylesterase 101-like n=1 Tax=Lycium barbarum TaxID=112863 RepID=UPI00293E4C0B|nr:senescence-associated carboxylesterase 101-like [Lycium barbarum]